ncbi:cupin domain-containing protein [Rhizobium paranaense]|uniref:Quercetin dioxygenase-like cupin family protein n=1 Tax=Rhizobium paranaense TaxID=1650438 RepID=A0A7W8XY24_9HYPH|nr:cupin domain-containing protein [Rhizobium paranaense]MBB5577690.1 quercetin dioxygenase-like cupin family protein [Rhizobium paranaense]
MIDLLEYPDTIEWLGVHYRTILATAATGGAMSIVDSFSPVGSGPPRHIHEREEETFILLSGSCEFWIEGETFTKKPGETVFVPRGTEHTFRVVGNRSSRHLVILTPGGFEGFFADMAAGQFQIPQDMDQIAKSAGRYSLRFTGPPLGAA